MCGEAIESHTAVIVWPGGLFCKRERAIQGWVGGGQRDGRELGATGTTRRLRRV